MDEITTVTNVQNADCFKVASLQIRFYLTPAYIGRLKEGIWEKLASYLLKYVREVDGVVISFWDVSLHQESGLILSDLPNYHFLVSSKFLLFSPSIGTKLRGVVQQVGIDHISLLCYGYFNAIICSSEMPSNYIRDVSEDCWRNTEDDSVIQTESILYFTVVGLNKLSGMMSIVGSLLDQTQTQEQLDPEV